MDGGCECPVCSEVYNHKTRVPKLLISCGHGTCEPCVRSLLSTAGGPKITCPECRTLCEVPDGHADKLPTIFPFLKLMDSLCAECFDRKHTKSCGHCTKNLCDICRESHYLKALPDMTDDIRDLRKLMEHLQDIINQENDFQTIQERGEHIIDEMKQSHKELINRLEQEHEKNIAQVRTEILNHSDMVLEWRGKLMKLLLDCKMFLDQYRVRIRLQTSDTREDRIRNTQQECQEKIEALRHIEAAKPDPQYLYVGYKEINIDRVLASYKALVNTQQTQTDGNISDDIIKLPDYTKATYKTMFDKGLSWPAHVCTDPGSGNIVCTDYSNDKVYILTGTLQLIHSFGSKGRGDGQYNGPHGISVYDGNFYISDRNNHRICVTDTQGAFLYTFGSEGTDRDQYKRPEGLSVDSRGLLYVCDTNNHRIKVTDRQGRYVKEFGHDVFGRDRPVYIAISTDDKVAVIAYNRIYMPTGDMYLFTTDGQHTQTIKCNTLPHDICPSGVSFNCLGQILVSDSNGRRLVVLSDQLKVKCFIGSPGTGPGQLTDPCGLAVTRNGGVVMCDSSNNRIQLFGVPLN